MSLTRSPTDAQKKLLRQWAVDRKDWPKTEHGAAEMLLALERRYKKPRTVDNVSQQEASQWFMNQSPAYRLILNTRVAAEIKHDRNKVRAVEQMRLIKEEIIKKEKKS